MSAEPAVTDVRMTGASVADQATGVIGFVRATIGGLIVDGITLRLTRAGALRLSFPEPTDRSGRRRAPVRPANATAHAAIEAEVLRALKKQGHLSGILP